MGRVGRRFRRFRPAPFGGRLATTPGTATVWTYNCMKREHQDNGEERTDEPTLVAEPESFGTWLRRQREVREIDLREIADSSKVSMSYLRAFEEDRFDVLPAPLFAKGFLRQYARYVGLDPEEVVNFYLAARQPESEEPSLQAHTDPEPPARNYLFLVLTVTAALVLLVWLLSVFGDRAPWATPAAAPRPESTGSGADETETRSPAAGGSPVTAPAGVDSGAAALPPPESSALAPEPAVPEPSSQQTPAPGLPLRVTLDFLSDCWVEASVDGAEKLSELKVQGESLLLGAREFVEFKVGDVDAVQVEVNGVPFEVEGRRGTSVRNVRIDLETAAAASAGGLRSPENDPESRQGGDQTGRQEDDREGRQGADPEDRQRNQPGDAR